MEPAMSTLKDKITDDMKTAMRAKDSARLLTIRGLLAALKQKEVDERIELDDVAVIAIVDKLVKQRKDSIAQFTTGGRQGPGRQGNRRTRRARDLPAPAHERRGEWPRPWAGSWPTWAPSGPGDMGKVMGAVKAKLAGKADMGQVSAAVKAALAPR